MPVSIKTEQMKLKPSLETVFIAFAAWRTGPWMEELPFSLREGGCFFSDPSSPLNCVPLGHSIHSGLHVSSHPASAFSEDLVVLLFKLNVTLKTLISLFFYSLFIHLLQRATPRSLYLYKVPLCEQEHWQKNGCSTMRERQASI